MAKHAHSTNSPKFHNVSSPALADELGRLDGQIKALEAEKDAIRKALQERGIIEAQGDYFAISFKKIIRATLDTASLKLKMGQSWYDDHCRLSEVTSLKIALVPQVAPAA